MLNVFVWEMRVLFHRPVESEAELCVRTGRSDSFCRFFARSASVSLSNGANALFSIYLVNKQYTCDHEELFDNLIQLVSHYKRDADGLCHRLVTPQVSDAFRLQYEAANREERFSEFELAGVVIPRSEVQLGDVVGHGEFGGELLFMDLSFPRS